MTAIEFRVRGHSAPRAISLARPLQGRQYEKFEKSQTGRILTDRCAESGHVGWLDGIGGH